MTKRTTDSITTTSDGKQRWFASRVLMVMLLFLPLGQSPVFAQDPPELTITLHEEGVLLDWDEPEGQSRWLILRSDDPFMDHADTLAITSSSQWLDRQVVRPEIQSFFYWVQPWIPGDTPRDITVIEDFETGDAGLLGYMDEDLEPNAGRIVVGGPGNSQFQLLMDGNTWKYKPLDPPLELDQSTVWSIDMFTDDSRSRLKMIGLGDGEDVMYYMIWGETANSDPWITTYLGWFPEDEWHTILLPVGADWHGRFANMGVIDRVIFVNDCDDVLDGSVQFDNLRDVTNALPLAPDASFQWAVAGEDEDSITYQFLNLSRDPDSDQLSYRWSFGDGGVSTDEHPVHRFPRGGAWPVALTVNDNGTEWSYQIATVVDSPAVRRSDFTISCMGDVVLKGAIEDMINNNGLDYPLENVADYIRPADLAICNLESPLTLSNNRHPTKSIFFKGRPEYAPALAQAGYDYVTIANNHILDYMVDGMHDTQQALDAAGVLWGGAGDNDNLAREVTHLSYGGKNLAILAMCNRDGHYNTANPPYGPQPFLDAGRNRPGFAMWNRTSIEETIPEVAENSDIVMCQVHCGSEYSRYPRDGDKDFVEYVDEVAADDPYVVFELYPDSGEVALRHYAIDMGADVVVCHHPHIIQGVEIYNGRLIVHSLGNFMFDMSPNETLFSMIAEIHVGADSIDAAVIRPAWMEGSRPHVVTGGFAANLLDYITYYSMLLNNTQVIRYPGSDIGHVMWDTTVERSSAENSVVLEWSDLEGEYRTRPFRLDGEGYPTRVELPELPPGQVEIRYGRDVLLWANMEDEGSQCWNLNSNYEFYDTEYSHERERSIKLNIPWNAPNGNYITEFERKIQLFSGNDHSFLGWLKTEDGFGAEFRVRLFNGRGDDNPTDQLTPVTLYGTNDWTPAWVDIDDLQNDQDYLNVRLNQSRPANGTAQAWFDDLAFIWWEEWQPVDDNQGVDIQYPSGYKYAQVRTTEFPGFAQEEEPPPAMDELDTSGGPDAFGYVFEDNLEPDGPQYEWVDITDTGNEITNMPDDGFQGPFPLPFLFSFYGNEYDEVYISSNGYISFGGGSGVWRNNDIPNPADPDNLICFFRDDLDPTAGGGNRGQIFYGTDEQGRWVCSFINMREYGANGRLTAQVILSNDQNILMQYESINFGLDIGHESIGIENSDGTIGLQVSLNDDPPNYPYEGLAIRIHQLIPDASVFGEITDADTGDPIQGATVRFGGFSTTSNDDGTYEIPSLFSGEYDVAVRAAGYFSHFENGVQVVEGANRFDYSLGAAPTVEIHWTREWPADIPAWGGIYEEQQAMR